jgi:hypothetical protein
MSGRHILEGGVVFNGTIHELYRKKDGWYVIKD